MQEANRAGASTSPLPLMSVGAIDAGLEHRDCPSCGSDRSVLVVAQRVDPTKLDRFAFASRKLPEHMHFRLVLCEECDLLYASPAPTAEALGRAYQEAAFDSAEESSFASATYATFLPAILSKVPDMGSALDIGTGDGSFLSVLRAAGVDDVVGVEPADPVTRRELERGLARGGEVVAPGDPRDPVGVTTRDPKRAVGRAGIDDDDLVDGPCDAREEAWQRRLLIADDHGERNRHGRSPYSASAHQRTRMLRIVRLVTFVAAIRNVPASTR